MSQCENFNINLAIPLDISVINGNGDGWLGKNINVMTGVNDTYYHCPISENQWVDLDEEKNYINIKCELSEGIVSNKTIIVDSDSKNIFN